MVFCWLLGFADRSYPSATFCRLAARVPQVGKQHRGGSADVGAGTRALVGEVGGTHGGAKRRLAVHGALVLGGQVQSWC